MGRRGAPDGAQHGRELLPGGGDVERLDERAQPGEGARGRRLLLAEQPPHRPAVAPPQRLGDGGLRERRARADLLADPPRHLDLLGGVLGRAIAVAVEAEQEERVSAERVGEAAQEARRAQRQTERLLLTRSQ